MIKTEVDYQILVNGKNKVPSNWNDLIKLVSIKNALGEDIKVEEKAYNQYLLLKKELEENGIVIDIESSHRSIEDQEYIWKDYTERYGLEYTKKYAAVPGYSEHHTGLAIDICIRQGDKLIIENNDMMSHDEIFRYIHTFLTKYGFILRYPKGKEDITGYKYEPWHLRYVGDIAKDIMDNSLTLEEYLNKVEI